MHLPCFNPINITSECQDSVENSLLSSCCLQVVQFQDSHEDRMVFQFRQTSSPILVNKLLMLLWKQTEALDVGLHLEYQTHVQE